MWEKAGNFPLGCWVTLTRPDCFWPVWHFIFLGSPHQALENPNHCGTRPTLLNSILISFLIYRIRLYLVFTLSSSLSFAFSGCQRCTHGSYSYRIVWLFISPFISYFYTVYTHSIHTLGALQHYNSGVLLEFYIYWHMLPGLSTYQWIFITCYSDYGKYYISHGW